MSDYNKIFHKVPIQVPNKSGFDCSHENLLTAKCGTLVPILVDPLLPNDSVTLGSSLQVQLPPMATDFYGRIALKLEAFFVPYRILYGGWKEFITHNNDMSGYPPGSWSHQKSGPLPFLSIPGDRIGPGSLSDYLGLKYPDTISASLSIPCRNPLSFIAYHKIYDDWYRDRKVQVPIFSREDLDKPTAYNLPYFTHSLSTAPEISVTTFPDNIRLYGLRQRNWYKDYFTNASPSPQAGNPMSVSFATDSATGSFSIASLRAANSIQQWLERNNLAGYLYGDQIKARFGIYPSDAITDRALYLGSSSVDVYTKSVYQQGAASASQNPFNSVGSKYGSSQGVGQSSLVDKFTASEHGFLFVIASLVPSAYYSSGSRRYLSYSKPMDFPDPLLAGVGDQEIRESEVADSLIPAEADTFGYTQRFSESKFMLDEVHGLLRDGQSLDSFCLQRSFDGSSPVSINSSFLQIPTNYLDQVTAVNAQVSNYGCWIDSYFKYHKSSTLPAYSIPTLGDPHDTHTEIIDNGGKRL